jgi:hypothetical protein
MFIGSNDQLVLELNEKEKEISMLNFLNKIRDSAKDSDELFCEVLKKSKTIMEAEMGFILIKNGKNVDIKSKEGEIDKKILNKLANDAIKSNQPIIYNQILNEDLIRANVSSVLSIPLVFDNNPSGAFLLLNKRFSRGFNRHDMKLASAIARQLYFASKKIDYVNNLEKTSKTLVFETQISNSKNKKSALKQIADLFDCEFGFIALNKDNKACLSVATKVLPKQLSELVESVASESITFAKLINHLEVSHELNSIICIPVIKEGIVKSVVGVVNSKNKKFSKMEKDLLSDFVSKIKLFN